MQQQIWLCFFCVLLCLLNSVNTQEARKLVNGVNGQRFCYPLENVVLSATAMLTNPNGNTVNVFSISIHVSNEIDRRI